jgi:hypothetical protein
MISLSKKRLAKSDDEMSLMKMRNIWNNEIFFSVTFWVLLFDQVNILAAHATFFRNKKNRFSPGIQTPAEK